VTSDTEIQVHVDRQRFGTADVSGCNSLPNLLTSHGIHHGVRLHYIQKTTAGTFLDYVPYKRKLRLMRSPRFLLPCVPTNNA
jgi:hypothetical protein